MFKFHPHPAPIVRLLFALLLAVALARPTRADEVVRIMAANITSGNLQSYDPGHGNRIFQGLKPDIALVQEMNFGNNTASALRAWVNANFGTGFSYFCEAGAQIPNGIVSRYPILASGEWKDSYQKLNAFGLTVAAVYDRRWLKTPALIETPLQAKTSR